MMTLVYCSIGKLLYGCEGGACSGREEEKEGREKEWWRVKVGN